MRSGIYIFKFPNNKIYVGQSINYNNRINGHLRGNQIVDRAIQKYGWENVKKEFEEVPEELLDLIEIAMINSYNSIFPNGYNMETGGRKNKHLSEETKRKQSESSKGSKNSFYGKHHSIETINKLSIAHMGKFGRKNSIDTKKKMSEIRINRHLSDSQRKKVLQFSKKNEFIKEWDSISQIEKEIGFLKSNISNACNKRTLKTAYGFIWKFK